jgi:hypothetical protein
MGGLLKSRSLQRAMRLTRPPSATLLLASVQLAGAADINTLTPMPKFGTSESTRDIWKSPQATLTRI